MQNLIVRLSCVLAALCGFHSSFAASWTTYGGTAERLNFNGFETSLSTTTVAGLKFHWKAKMPFQSITQPLYVPQVGTANGVHDEVYTTTKNGWVFALNAATGATDWSVLTPTGASTCGGFAVLGIFGTPTIDPVAKKLYVVDGTGGLHALDIGSGAEAPGYPIEVIDPLNANNVTFNHSSPTLVGGMLYITTSGPCEYNTDPYHGQIIEFNPASLQIVNRYFPVGNTPSVRGAGMWGPGGVSAEADGLDLYAATGNAMPQPDTAPHAEEILQLDRNLNLLASNGPAFSRGGDYDFASTPLLINSPSCPPLVEIMNKTGLVLLYQRSTISAGPIQSLQVSYGGGNSKFLGMPSFDPDSNLVFLNNPLASKDGTFENGLIAFQVTSGCMLATLWQQQIGSNLPTPLTRATAPVIANGVVYVSTGAGNQVMALDELTGAVLWTSGTTITGATTFSPTVSNGQLFVSGDQFLYAFGL